MFFLSHNLRPLHVPRALCSLLQLLHLLPHHIRPEPPERRLDPPLTLLVRPDRPPRAPATRQHPCLAAQEQSAGSKEQACSRIPQPGRLHHRGQVGQSLLFARCKPDVRGLLGGAEGAEHLGPGLAYAEGEEEPEGQAGEGADGDVGGEGGGSGAEGVAVGLLEAERENQLPVGCMGWRERWGRSLEKLSLSEGL